MTSQHDDDHLDPLPTITVSRGHHRLVRLIGALHGLDDEEVVARAISMLGRYVKDGGQP